MGVYIKGMEMPKCCGKCPISCLSENHGCYKLRCNLLHRFVSENVIDVDCPLVEVSPHGRLIDADKIRYHSGTWEKGCDWVMQSEIALMPTVIPADEEESE